MSTGLQKDDVAQDIHQQEQEQEKKSQDTKIEADNQKKEKNGLATTKEEKEETIPEKQTEENGVVTAHKGLEKIPVNTATQKTLTETSQSCTKRKFDALDARISDPKTKKDGANVKLTKVSATKKINQSTTKTREFSFARPTESSARRTAALTENHTKNMKATPPSFKLQQLKRTPAKAQCASTPILKTPTETAAAADKASRAHFSYTPYTGPLPPLTVESSFAPKNGQMSDRRAWSAPPAQTKGTASARKPRLASVKEMQLQSTTGKENSGVNTKEKTATNVASSSQPPVTPGKTNGIACE
ncbi:unnamed protein product [Peronospora effusa]|nr:unnamed protein product [Peronospora effusa]